MVKTVDEYLKGIMAKNKTDGSPAWEPGLRIRLATMCMAAAAGKEGDLQAATEQTIEFCRTLAGVDK